MVATVCQVVTKTSPDRLTDACRPLLRGEQPLRLRREEDAKPKRGGGEATRGGGTRFASGVDESLWQDLRALRKRLADEQGVPPYVIFSDATLLELAARKPRTLEEFATIKGVGEKKLADLGETFLAAIAG